MQTFILHFQSVSTVHICYVNLKIINWIRKNNQVNKVYTQSILITQKKKKKLTLNLGILITQSMCMNHHPINQI